MTYKLLIPKVLLYISLLINRVFMRCITLEEVVFNKELEEIGYCAFRDCEKLKKIEIPNMVREIKKEAFYLLL